MQKVTNESLMTYIRCAIWNEAHAYRNRPDIVLGCGAEELQGHIEKVLNTHWVKSLGIDPKDYHWYSYIQDEGDVYGVYMTLAYVWVHNKNCSEYFPGNWKKVRHILGTRGKKSIPSLAILKLWLKDVVLPLLDYEWELGEEDEDELY